MKALLSDKVLVVGLDNLNDYYDPSLKRDRLRVIDDFVSLNGYSANYAFEKADISDNSNLRNIFEKYSFDVVINLAAQAGVRYSIENPDSYIQSNLVGFANILECCRNSDIEHLLFASSSSVYGMNKDQPFSTSDLTDSPVSLYAATKKSNELLAYSYSHLYKIPSTGLRFFTVYGPYGRPDMAYYSFTKAIEAGEPIKVFNGGDMERDFTYIDDIISGIVKLISRPPSDKATEKTNAEAPFSIFNIGNNQPVTLRRFIAAIEKSLAKKAIEERMPMQPGDVKSTYANIDDLTRYCGFTPSTSIEEGIGKFVAWYLERLRRSQE